MRMAFFLLLAFSASPVQALEYCDELWFTRNLVFDRVGYCFGSPLGQSVFGTANCRTKSPQLSPAETDFVNRIKALEAEWGCRIDTARRGLAIPALAARKALWDLPVPSPYESACIGWRGTETPLLAGLASEAPVIASILPGDTVLWEFEDAGAWSFVSVTRGGQFAGFGWTVLPTLEGQCNQVAG